MPLAPGPEHLGADLHDLLPVPGASPKAWFTITPDASAYFTSYGSIQGDLFRVTGWK